MEIYDNDLNAEIIGFGALNVDKLYSVDRIVSHDEESFIKNETVTPGGSAANTIVGLARLGCSTSIIGKIAEDDEYFQGFVINPHSQNFNMNRNGEF